MYGRATFDNDVKPPHSCNPVNKLSSVVLNPDEKKKKIKKKRFSRSNLSLRYVLSCFSLFSPCVSPFFSYLASWIIKCERLRCT